MIQEDDSDKSDSESDSDSDSESDDSSGSEIKSDKKNERGKLDKRHTFERSSDSQFHKSLSSLSQDTNKKHFKIKNQLGRWEDPLNKMDKVRYTSRLKHLVPSGTRHLHHCLYH